MRRFIPTIVVLGIMAVGFVVFARRLKDLGDRLAFLERRTAGAGTKPPGGFVPQTTSTESPPPASTREEPPSQRSVDSPPVAAEKAPIPSTTPALPPDVQAAVAREVERILQERGPILPMVHNSKEPIEVMEEELGLTPGQKLRIAELIKQRDEEMKALAEKHPPQEVMKRFPEVEERYEQTILRELDVAQQKKYLELQKTGKFLGPGHVFFFSAGVEERK